MADTYNMSDYLESALYDHLLRGSTFSKPATLAFALCSGVPVSSNTGANIPEFGNGAGYARVNYGAPANSGWQAKPADTGGANNLVIQWPAATAQWGTASGIAILDSDTFGAGNMLFWAAITTPKLIQTTDAPYFASGQLVINLD